MNKKLKNYIVLFVLIIPMFFSCEKSVEMGENTNMDNQSNLLNSKINVRVRVCENLYCTEFKTLSNVEVKLKKDDSESFYRKVVTDELGEIIFSSINENALTVIAEYEGQEYQEKISVGQDEVLHIDVLFSPYCDMDGHRLVNCNTKIDFEHMSVGQVSRYVMYKTNEEQLSVDKSFYFTGDTLVLEVMKRINDTEWSVKEEFVGETSDSIFEYIINTKPTTCIWDVQSDYMKIYPTAGNEPSNFTNIYTYDYDVYKIPFIAEGSNYCELDEWFTADCGYDGTPRFIEAVVNGKKYNDELILDRRSGIDIPQLGILYNKQEGIVHTYTFGTMQHTRAYGFDLIQ